jgi:hypothetical protein
MEAPSDRIGVLVHGRADDRIALRRAADLGEESHRDILVVLRRPFAVEVGLLYASLDPGQSCQRTRNGTSSSSPRGSCLQQRAQEMFCLDGRLARNPQGHRSRGPRRLLGLDRPKVKIRVPLGFSPGCWALDSAWTCDLCLSKALGARARHNAFPGRPGIRTIDVWAVDAYRIHQVEESENGAPEEHPQHLRDVRRRDFSALAAALAVGARKDYGRQALLPPTRCKCCSARACSGSVGSASMAAAGSRPATLPCSPSPTP